ncbi:hypothetical protein ABFS82_04G185800 [Erythranthe guttata]|uniref:uncharacterized protein LOC105949015 n=1 Tax=Erythranthe guttata TaxID=4155 RepID=UPI00064DC46F|nr:PREDICTED: uncharacterized protein LOC105949015 [Erythranthe guttata]|eukprot:XP_012827736.1 PREDICTED: uncharacterized protein LOC105949015 [Erythranthe guttata]
MGEMDASWGFEEYNNQNHEVEQLKQKLLFTTLELEKLRSEAMEQMRQNKAYVSHLINLLKCAFQERDDAKTHLQKLLNNNNITIMPPQANYMNPSFRLPETPLPKPVNENPNSSVTGSNSVASLFDPVFSPDFSNILVQECCNKVDEGNLVIDRLVKGKPLPKRGKFLQTVVEAGPLLQNILVAGPLPTWRNPPQLCQGGDVSFYQKPATNVTPLLARGSKCNASLISCGY